MGTINLGKGGFKKSNNPPQNSVKFSSRPFIFDKILLDAAQKGIFPNKSRESQQWFFDKARAIKKVQNEREIMLSAADKGRLKNSVKVGGMYMFYYDPKLKEKLPYYDMVPLIFPIKRYKDGFLGLNVHYIPYRERAALMDALYSVTNNNKFDESTKLKISYDILKAAAKYKWFKPCLKRYLSQHLRSRLFYIQATEWQIAAFLPLARWQKASQQRVWSDSRKIVRGK